jgi:hypothetical protein
MKIEKESRSIIHSDPFQLQMPSSLGLTGSTPDGYYTFRLEISFGAGGVEGVMPLYTLEKDGGESDDPSWWSCFGLTQIPGLKPRTSELRLFFENSTYYDCNQGVIASWDDSDPLFSEASSNLWSAFNDDNELLEAANIVKQLLAAKFATREIADPAAQVPGYKTDHHATLFAAG